MKKPKEKHIHNHPNLTFYEISQNDKAEEYNKGLKDGLKYHQEVLKKLLSGIDHNFIVTEARKIGKEYGKKAEIDFGAGQELMFNLINARIQETIKERE